MDNRHPGYCRLRKSWEYQLVRKMGCKFYAPHFVLLVFDNTLKNSRLGITVSRKVGNAVERNRLKRITREFFRVSSHLYPGLKDYSVIARRGAAQLSCSEINIELKKMFLLTATIDD